MHNNNTIKLLKLQGKNLKIEKEIIDDINNEAYFFISRKIKPCKCPHCNTITKHVHDYRDQYIRHSPINGFKTFLVLHKARLICPNCYHKFYANYSDIVNPRFRCSNILFFDIINTLKDTSMTFDEVANFFGVSSGVVTRYLDFFSYLMEWNNITCLPKHIGIDEFKGNCDASKYLFHIYDLDTNQTIYILKSRKYNDVVKFFNNISNRNDVEIVTMDLYDSFRNAVKAKLKRATIIADRFHYTRIVSRAFDELRIQLWRDAKGLEKKYLKNLKLSLLLDINSVKPQNILKLEEKLNYAFDLNPKLKYAYQLYQSFLRIKDGDTYQERVKRFRDWLDDAISSTLPKFKSAAETLLRWSHEIVNSLKTSYTNSSTEGKNNKIKVIKRNAYGFKKLKNLRNLVKLRDFKYSEI